MRRGQRLGEAWPTLVMFAACYGAWALAVLILPAVSLALAIAVAGVGIALHASLQHEAIHGNPFVRPWLNDMIAFPALTLVVPYGRFRDTHLAHHRDANLTDPYDDPESHFLDPGRWQGLAGPLKAVLLFHNTLLGRMLLGPVVGTVGFLLNEVRAFRSGDSRVLQGWLWHLPAVAVVLAFVGAAPMPLWAYLVAAYLGLALLKIRTFLEHRAHAAARARTVIVEDCGPLSWLFLNNNYHVVHHMHPQVPWHRLPALYRADRQRYLKINEGYRYRSYGDVIRRYFLTRKDPVAHPLMAPASADPAPGQQASRAGRDREAGAPRSEAPVA